MSICGMVDITESSLFNPTAPPESLISKSSRSMKLRSHKPIFTTSKTMCSREKKEDTGTIMSEILDINLDQMSTSRKVHSSPEKQFDASKKLEAVVVGDRNVRDLNSLSMETQGHSQTVEDPRSGQDQTYGRSYTQKKTLINVFFKLYVAMKAKLTGEPESDQDELLGEDSSNESGAQRSTLNTKTPFLVLSRKQKASCKIAFQSTKRMMKVKSKYMTKSFKRACLDWAYGAGNANSFLFAQSGIVSMNEFYPCNFSAPNNQINV